MLLSPPLLVPKAHVFTRPAEDAYCLPSSSLSYSAESLALVHRLEWCHSYLKHATFNRLLHFPKAPAFVQPKSFWDIWDLFDSISFRVALNFQWVPSHAGLPGIELAESLAKTLATLPLPMFLAR